MDKASTFSPELSKLLEAGVHFGHQARRWHPKMQRFIWQQRDGVHIFDLLKTSEYLQKACETAKEFVASGKTIVFVGTKRQAAPIVKAEAERAGAPYITSRWAGGMISNWSQVKKSIARLENLREGLKNNKFSHYTKKERVLLDREMTRLQRLFGGIKDLKNPPEALFIIDISREKAAIKEAKAAGAKIFAIVDSNVNPDLVDYPIPGNDDAVRSISILVETFANAVAEGKAIADKKNTTVSK
jgi:small subunit ribosomal protein S2